MILRFLLVCEGSSDTGLLPHIGRLLVQLGYNDPRGDSWHIGNPLAERIRQGLRLSGGCDLLIVHRDADSDEETQSAGPAKRADEIREAVDASGYGGMWTGIVPVRMTETWLLLDEKEIRRAAGKPNGTQSLSLPSQSQVESESDPKGCLERALLTASETTGRRREKFGRDIPQMRRALMEELPVGGLLEQVLSWVRFRDGLAEALADVRI